MMKHNAALNEQRMRWKAARERMKPQAKVITMITAPTRTIEVRNIRAKKVYGAPIGPDPFARTITAPETVKRICAEVCAKHFVSWLDITSERRNRCYTEPRFELMYRLVTETTWSTPRIGRLLNRDHSTILNGLKRHRARLAATDD